MTLLEVEGLSVRFDTEDGPLLAVDAASFTMADGEVLALVGESGCGKSVTAMALTGLLPRNAYIEGSVRFAGRELTRESSRRLTAIRGRDIAYVFQEPMSSLNPVLTVGRQIGEVLRRHQHTTGAVAQRRARDLRLDDRGQPEVSGDHGAAYVGWRRVARGQFRRESSQPPRTISRIRISRKLTAALAPRRY